MAAPVKTEAAAGKPSAPAWASALFSLTLFFYAPAQIFLTNRAEFDFRFSGLLPYLAGLALAGFLLVRLALKAVPEAAAEKALALLIAASYLLWFQGNVLAWDYGVLNGRDIPWAEKSALGLIDTALWLLLALLALWQSRAVRRAASPLSVALVAVQTLALLAMMLPGAPASVAHKFGIDSSGKFSFSSERNVIVVVLDTFQADLFQELLNKDNGLRGDFAGFTYFRNSLGGSPTTITAVPFILTARQFDNSRPLPEFLKAAYRENSLPLLLKRSGFRCDMFAMPNHGVYLDKSLASNLMELDPVTPRKVAFLVDLGLFRQLPHWLKKAVYHRQEWLLTRCFTSHSLAGMSPARRRQLARQALSRLPDRSFVQDMLARARADRRQPVFKFYHLRGVHPPLHMNESGEYERMPFNRASTQRQAAGLLKLMARFLSRLKRIDAFRESLIFIVGDHGPGNWGLSDMNLAALGLSQPELGEVSALRKIKAGAIPLMLAKPLGRADTDPLIVSDAPVCLGDIPVTAASACGLANSFPGESLFQVADKEERSRRYLYYKGFRVDKRGYIQTMDEYWVRGFSWLDRSWQASGRRFPAGGRGGPPRPPSQAWSRSH